MPEEASTTRQKNSPSSLRLSRSFQDPAFSIAARGVSQAKLGIIPPPSHDEIKNSCGTISLHTGSAENTASLGLRWKRAQAAEAREAPGAPANRSIWRRILLRSST